MKKASFGALWTCDQTKRQDETKQNKDLQIKKGDTEYGRKKVALRRLDDLT